MALILTDDNQLRQAVSDVVLPLLREEIPNLVREGFQKPVLTQDEVRTLTGWDNRKLRYLRKTKQVAFVPMGRSFAYPTADLLRFLETKKVRVRRDLVPTWTESLEEQDNQPGAEG